MGWDKLHPYSFLMDSMRYKIADIDDSSDPKYYGFVDKEGGWLILKEDTTSSPKTYRYERGTSGYTANWTNRAALTYYYYYERF